MSTTPTAPSRRSPRPAAPKTTPKTAAKTAAKTGKPVRAAPAAPAAKKLPLKKSVRPAALPKLRPAVAAPTPRRTPAPRAANSLLLLRDNLVAIDAQLSSVRQPVAAVHQLIGQLKAPLALPARIKQDLSELISLLTALRTIAQPLGLLPGPIGAGANAFKRGLQPLVGPPAKGALGRARDAVAKIDQALKPLRALLSQAAEPVDKTLAALDAMQGGVAHLRDIVAVAIRQFGSAPPPDALACADKLNGPVGALRAALDEAAAGMAQAFAALGQALTQVLKLLAPLNDVARVLTSALGKLRGKAMAAIISTLRRFANAIKPYVDKIEIVVKAMINSVLKALKIKLGTLTGFFDKLLAAINPLKPVEKALASALVRLKAQLAKLVDVSGLATLQVRLEALRRQLERTVADFMASSCRAVLDPGTARALGMAQARGRARAIRQAPAGSARRARVA